MKRGFAALKKAKVSAYISIYKSCLKSSLSVRSFRAEPWVNLDEIILKIVSSPASGKFLSTRILITTRLGPLFPRTARQRRREPPVFLLAPNMDIL
jgi:hypothetical protein